MAPIPIPPHGTPFIDPATGQVHLLWQNYLLALQNAFDINSAPKDAQFWTSRSNADLTAERNIGALSTGYLKIATVLGVATPSSTATLPVTDLSGTVALANGGTAANLNATGGASQVLQQASAGAAVTVGPLASTDIGGVVSSTYTPTLFNVANMAASTAYATTYLRVGTTVVVGGRVDIDPTLAATATQLGISLPVASNFANPNECGGTAATDALASTAARIYGDAANNRAELGYVTGADAANRAWSFHFVYTIL